MTKASRVCATPHRARMAEASLASHTVQRSEASLASHTVQRSEASLPSLAVQRSEARVVLEHQLVGSILYHALDKPYLAGDVLALCPSDSFVSSKAKVAMQAIQAVVNRGQAVDLVSVGLEIQKQGEGNPLLTSSEFAGFAVSVSSLITEASVLQAARQTAVEWRKDQAAVQLSLALQGMHTFGDSPEVSLRRIREAESLLDAELPGEQQTFDALLDAYELDFTRYAERQTPVPTPWPAITRILRGGVLPAELVILAARPSVGKTAFALNWAYAVACSGKPVVLFSLEMARAQLFNRLVANVGNVDVGAFREGLTARQQQDAKKALASLRGKPLEILDDAWMTLSEIRRRIRILQRRHTHLGLVVVDYLQLITTEDKRLPREQQVAEMSRGLKLLAKDLRVPVLLLAQLNRKSEEARREPVLSDLRESGSIEQDADIVIFLHQARTTWHPDEPVKVLVAKGRSSGVGQDSLVFRRRVQRFEDAAGHAFAHAQQQEREVAAHWQDLPDDGLV